MDIDFSAIKPATNLSILQKKAKEALWLRGEFLPLVLDTTQQAMVEAFRASESVFYIWLCSRRIGKSVALIAVAVEQALKNPNTRILYLSKTTDNVREIVDQASSVVLIGCPEEIKPWFNKNENKFIFHNGSEIRVKGLDLSGSDAIRGVKGELVILDEFCFMKNLNTTISSVIMPMVIECGGRVLLASSAPNSPGHESIEWIQKAEDRGAITLKTIDDCPRWGEKQKQTFLAEAGGKDSSTARREYYCEIIVEREHAILPSFTAARAEEIIKAIPFPYDYIPDTYVSLDIGFRDLSVALFAWWDYENAKLVIQDEVILKGAQATTENIAAEILKKERELWPNLEPHKRVCDTDPRLIEDLKRLHNLHFRPTKKDNKEAQINQANIMIGNNTVLINPKCKTLIAHGKYGIWNPSHTSFMRTSALGHCDAIDSLLYLIRNIDRNRNPHENPSAGLGQIWHGNEPDRQETKSVSAIRKMFGRR